MPPTRRIALAAAVALCAGADAGRRCCQGFSTRSDGQGDRVAGGHRHRRRRGLRRRHHHRPAPGRLARAGVRGGLRAGSSCAPSAWRARTWRPSPTRPSSSSSTPTTTTTSRSSCATRSTTCPTCCATSLETTRRRRHLRRRPAPPRLRPLPRRRRQPRRLPDRIVIFRDTLLSRLRARPGPAARPGHAHRAPRARPPPRLRRARRPRPRALAGASNVGPTPCGGGRTDVRPFGAEAARRVALAPP